MQPVKWSSEAQNSSGYSTDIVRGPQSARYLRRNP